MKGTRKDFLKTIGAGILGTSVLSPLSAFSKVSIAAGNLNFGLASYSFRNFDLDHTIEMTKRLNLKFIGLKSMHMPLDNTVEQIKATAKKVRDAGLDLYNAGVIYMNSEDEVNNAFNYVQAAGLKIFVGVPKYDLLPLVEKKVREYDIKVAIHNHGPGDQLYSSPDDVIEKVKDLDKRIGLCLDIGHTFRINQDPAKKAKQYADRLMDIHFKDVDGTGSEGKELECGRGIMDLPGFLKALLSINYQGVVAFEFEKDADDPLPGAAESVGYTRGVMDVLTA